jgi:hypothetical protein
LPLVAFVNYAKHDATRDAACRTNPTWHTLNSCIQRLIEHFSGHEGIGLLTIVFGSELQPPRYDLANFSDSIPANLPGINVGPAKTIKPPRAAEGATVFTSRILIWVAIIAVIGVLGFMAIKMTREL